MNELVPASAQELTTSEQVEELFSIKKALDEFFKNPEVIERIQELSPENLKVVQSNRKKIDYASSDHPSYDNLLAVKKEVDSKLKEIEKLLASLTSPLDIVVQGQYKLVFEQDIPANVTIKPPFTEVSVIKYLKG